MHMEQLRKIENNKKKLNKLNYLEKRQGSVILIQFKIDDACQKLKDFYYFLNHEIFIEKSHESIYNLYQNLNSMNTIKEMIKECDFFSHSQFLRYRKEQNFRTLTGGIVSVTLMIVFAALFFSKVSDTFNYNIIKVDSVTVSYDLNPSYYELVADPAENFMFTFGVQGIDLSSSVRYFDITLQNFTVITNGSNQNKITNSLAMAPCTIDQWSGVNDAVYQQFAIMNFSQFLCPPTGFVIPMQGKFTSELFQYARVLVSQCTNNSLFPNTTCATQAQVNSFIASSGSSVTIDFYFINPVLNPANKKYIDYYFEDGNYFTFTTTTGILANIYFSQYQIKTDESILPWTNDRVDDGLVSTSLAIGQTYLVSSNNQYAKIYLRKASQHQDTERSFQKIDQTLSFIGGLFGMVMLIFLLIVLYDKYSYQIEFGDRLFKQDNGGSFGSHRFNFVVFLGYVIFNLFTKLGANINWKTMKVYHKCRQECLKQLDIHLIFKKIEFFEQAFSILLEEHHIRGLHLVPKPMIQNSKKSRKRYLMQNVIYHQLDRKAQEVFIEQEEYDQHRQKFIKQHKEWIGELAHGDIDMGEEDLQQLSHQINMTYYNLDNTKKGESYSRKIIGKMGIQNVLQSLIEKAVKNREKEIEQEKEKEKQKEINKQKKKVKVQRNSIENAFFDSITQVRLGNVNHIQLEYK